MELLLLGILAIAAWWIWRALSASSRRTHQPHASATPATADFDMGTLLQRVRDADVELRYSDRDGVPTTRRVTVREIWGKRGDRSDLAWANWIVGYCHLRREDRRFSVRRIDWIREPGQSEASSAEPEPWIARRFAIRDMPPPVEPRPITTRKDVAPPPVLMRFREGKAIIYDWTVAIHEVETHPDGSVQCFRGKARREKTQFDRAWGGQKTFYVTEGAILSMADAATGEVIPDPEAWLKALPPA